MACEKTRRKLALWQLQFYRQAISEKYDQIIHWIWVLNKISEVLCSTEATKNYNDLKEMVRQSRKCQGWNFLEKIGEIESKCESRNVFLEFMKSAVEKEKCNNIEEAKRIHKILKDFHSMIEGKKKEKVTEWRKEKDVDYEKLKSLLPKEEVEVPSELLKMVGELEISSPSKEPDHACGLCECYHVTEQCLQTTQLNLKDKKVVKSCKILSENFQGSVRERLKEDFPTLPEGIFRYKFIHKKKRSPKKKKQNSEKGSASKNKAKSVASCQLGKDDQSNSECNPKSRKSEKEISGGRKMAIQTPSGAICVVSDSSSKMKEKEKGEPPHDEIEGIGKVAQLFIEFDKLNGNSKKALVILARYRSEDFLKYVNDVGGYVTKQETEFDIMIISPQIGILCGQIKATTDTASNLLRQICYAALQCQISKSVFREMFRDKIDMFDIPVYEFIALPFVTREALNVGSKKKDGKLYTHHHPGTQLSRCSLYSNILTKEDMDTEERFISWLQKIHGGNVDISDKWIMSEEQYWTLLERFVGFGSETEIVSYPKHINDIGDNCFKIPLTDDQRHLVNKKGAQYQFLTLAGDYGTGKSLILVKKAVNIAREISTKKEGKGKVIIVACSDICLDGKYLDRQFPEHTVHHLQKLCKGHFENIISVETFRSFTKPNSPDLSGIKGMDLLRKAISHMKEGGCELHLMFDEVPAMFVENMQSPECQEIFSECLKLITTLWIVIGTHSYRVWRDNSTDRCVKDCKPSPHFKHVYLDKVLRSPKNVFKVSQEISKHCEDDHQGFLRNSCLGPQPKLFRVPACDCNQKWNGQASRNYSVESNPLKCACIRKRLSCTLRTVFQEIGIFEDGEMVEDVKKWPGKVTMLVFGVEDDSLLNDLHSLLKACCKDIAGLYFRDTIMGESRQRDGNDRAGQGNKVASAWGCLGESFESTEGLNNNETCLKDNLSMAVEGLCMGNSFDRDLNSSEVTSQDIQSSVMVRECQWDGSVSEEGLNVKVSEITGQENINVGVEGCCIDSPDNVDSSSSSDDSLGIVREAMDKEEFSGASVASKENLPSSEVSRQGKKAVALDGCGGASTGRKESSEECKGETKGVQERLDCEENNNKVDIDCCVDRPKILLTRATYFVGCESHVVICIDVNAMKHWFKNTKVAYSTLAVSRCLSQYIHLTWQDEEADIMFKMNVKAFDEDLGSDDKKNIEKVKEQSTLGNLCKDGVITEQTVNMNL